MSEQGSFIQFPLFIFFIFIFSPFALFVRGDAWLRSGTHTRQPPSLALLRSRHSLAGFVSLEVSLHRRAVGPTVKVKAKAKARVLEVAHRHGRH